MTHKTNHRSRAILLMLVVMALATAGLVYAHWTETLQVNAQIDTGSAVLTVSGANTDDDGNPDGWDGPDNGSGTEYDRWLGTSSNDPSSYTAPGVGTRYTKDVARCRATGTVGQTSTVLVENAFPSYHCTIRQSVRNTGSTPLANQATRAYACGPDPGLDCSNYPTNFVAVPYTKATDSFTYDSGDGDPDFELVMQHNPDGVCGYQFNPGVSFQSAVTFHVLQDAAQSGTYVIRWELDQVNWNEWSLGACTGFDRYTPTGSGTTYPIP